MLNQYKAGTVSYLNVVTVQTALLNEERNAVGPRARRRLGRQRGESAQSARRNGKGR